MNTFDILIRPIITEKSTVMQERARYTFEVAEQATKLEVKRAIEQAFNVSVLDVNTMHVRGKRKRFGPRIITKKGWKKAVITLAPGNTITIFEGV